MDVDRLDDAGNGEREIKWWENYDGKGLPWPCYILILAAMFLVLDLLFSLFST